MIARSIIEMRDAHPQMFAPQDVARFWTKVKKSDACWLWQASTTTFGYGQHRVGSLKNGDRRIVGAHRFSWLLANGSIPSGMFVCHHCDTPRCVRPDHLFLGTPSDNMRDKVAKGRAHDTSGEKSAVSKLDWTAVQDIRSVPWDATTARHLAEKYGVTQQTIRMIRRGLAWTKEAA